MKRQKTGGMRWRGPESPGFEKTFPGFKPVQPELKAGHPWELHAPALMRAISRSPREVHAAMRRDLVVSVVVIWWMLTFLMLKGLGFVLQLAGRSNRYNYYM